MEEQEAPQDPKAILTQIFDCLVDDYESYSEDSSDSFPEYASDEWIDSDSSEDDEPPKHIDDNQSKNFSVVKDGPKWMIVDRIGNETVSITLGDDAVEKNSLDEAVKKRRKSMKKRAIYNKYKFDYLKMKLEDKESKLHRRKSEVKLREMIYKAIREQVDKHTHTHRNT